MAARTPLAHSRERDTTYNIVWILFKHLHWDVINLKKFIKLCIGFLRWYDALVQSNLGSWFSCENVVNGL